MWSNMSHLQIWCFDASHYNRIPNVLDISFLTHLFISFPELNCRNCSSIVLRIIMCGVFSSSFSISPLCRLLLSPAFIRRSIKVCRMFNVHLFTVLLSTANGCAFDIHPFRYMNKFRKCYASSAIALDEKSSFFHVKNKKNLSSKSISRLKENGRLHSFGHLSHLRTDEHFISKPLNMPSQRH